MLSHLLDDASADGFTFKVTDSIEGIVDYEGDSWVAALDAAMGIEECHIWLYYNGQEVDWMWVNPHDQSEDFLIDCWTDGYSDKWM